MKQQRLFYFDYVSECFEWSKCYTPLPVSDINAAAPSSADEPQVEPEAGDDDESWIFMWFGWWRNALYISSTSALHK